MKTLKIVLMVALAIGVISVFAGVVSAVNQTSDPVMAKEVNDDAGVALQTTGQNENGNISKIDLNGTAKPEEAVNVENLTISEPNKGLTDIAPVQSAGNSTKIGKEANSMGLQSGDKRESTNKGRISVKAQGWIEDTKKFVDQVGKSFTDNVVVPIVRLLRPEITINASGNNSSWNAYINAHAASKTQRSKKYKK